MYSFNKITLGFLFVFLLLSNGVVFAQYKTDSLQYLPEVVITTGKTYREVIPAQKLTGEELKTLNSFSVADAIRYFSGVQIKDYGGIGGLKTVNIRSLGTNQVGVFYDGIQLGNAQNGQIDLGKFSLDNIEEISLYNGQKSDILQSAKDYGSAASVYLRSRTPSFSRGKKHNLKAVFKTGSFDLINPSLLFEHKFSDDLSASINGEYINSSGKYKYRYKRVHPGTSEVMYDTTAVRENGDIESIRFETGLYGLIDQGHWKWKNYFYNSERGMPGAIINNRWMNPQRQWDRSFFSQASMLKAFGNNYELQANAKYAHDYMRYVNPDTTLMLIDNNFRQQEFYLSLANRYTFTPYWEASISADMQYNTLTTNMAGSTFPKRLTNLIAIASTIELGSVKIQGSALATFVSDKTNRGTTNEGEKVKAATNKEEFTPAMFLSYKPFVNHNFNVRAFYKNIFRMPTFNDLYYTDIGKANVKPEFTHQYNLGFQYTKTYKNSIVKEAQLQADGYYNEIMDKIVAVMKGAGQYRWMVMNYGYVEIRGIDVASSAVMEPYKDLFLNLKLTYTYQKAQDFTERPSDALKQTTYGGQIAYIPWHSGSTIASLNYKTWQLNYSFIYVGERYQASANIQENYEQPWYTNDMALIKNIVYRNMKIKVSAEVNNFLGQNYEVVINYPMPQTNYKLSLTFEI